MCNTRIGRGLPQTKNLASSTPDLITLDLRLIQVHFKIGSINMIYSLNRFTQLCL